MPARHIGDYRNRVVILTRSLATADVTGEQVESWPTPQPLGTGEHWAAVDSQGGGELASQIRQSFGTRLLKFRHLVALTAVDKVRLKETGELFTVAEIWRERAESGGWQTVAQLSGDSSPDTTAPTLLSATIDATGTTLTIIFSEEVTGYTGFTLVAGGGDGLGAAVTPTYSSGNGSTSLVFTLSRTVYSSETVNLLYEPGDVADWAFNAMLEASADVTNNSTQDIFLPSDVANLSAWYAARLETSPSDGVAILPADISGNANNHTQATGTKKPLYTANVINGQPVYRYDGVDDTTSATFTLGPACTEFVVMKLRANPSGGNGAIIDRPGGFANQGVYRINNGSSTWLMQDGGSSITVGNLGNSAFHVLTAKWNGASSSGQIDQVAAVTGNAGSDSRGGIQFGGPTTNLATAVDIAEVIVYNRILTAPEITNVQAYLRGVYNL